MFVLFPIFNNFIFFFQRWKYKHIIKNGKNVFFFFKKNNKTITKDMKIFQATVPSTVMETPEI
jgi:hypothetical protein